LKVIEVCQLPDYLRKLLLLVSGGILEAQLLQTLFPDDLHVRHLGTVVSARFPQFLLDPVLNFDEIPGLSFQIEEKGPLVEIGDQNVSLGVVFMLVSVQVVHEDECASCTLHVPPIEENLIDLLVFDLLEQQHFQIAGLGEVFHEPSAEEGSNQSLGEKFLRREHF